MASGYVNRINRPNTWLHRPSLRREDSPCQLGAVHTWPLASFRCAAKFGRSWGHSGHSETPSPEIILAKPIYTVAKQHRSAVQRGCFQETRCPTTIGGKAEGGSGHAFCSEREVRR
jgi:hypothetical protein